MKNRNIHRYGFTEKKRAPKESAGKFTVMHVVYILLAWVVIEVARVNLF